MDVKKEYYKMLGEKLKKALEKNGFCVKVVSSPKEALETAIHMIPRDAAVGVGGSVTVRQIGLVDELKKRGNPLYAHWEAEPKQSSQIRKKELTSDVFITGTNAITLDGKLVNIDGVGNRVAAMMYGPGKVIVIAGVNKGVESVEDAIKRIKNVASPQNALRLGRSLPCAKTGKCHDCDSPERMCSITTIIEKKPPETDITIILVEDELGY